MNKGVVAAMICIAALGWSLTAGAEEVAIKDVDTIAKLLEGQKGKKVTLRLGAGDELTGTVRNINKDLVHLGELTGKEYFDAYVEMHKISAVIVRVKNM